MNLDAGNDVAVCIFVRNKGNRNISEVEIVAAEGVENAQAGGEGTGSIEGLSSLWPFQTTRENLS